MPKRYEDASEFTTSPRVLPADVLPEPLAELSSEPPDNLDAFSHTVTSQTGGDELWVDSPKNRFGLFRRFLSTSLPTHDPDAVLDPSSLIDLEPDRQPYPHPIESATALSATTVEHGREQEASVNDQNPATNVYSPFPDQSTFRLAHAWWTGAREKSQGLLEEIVRIVTSPKFDKDAARTVDWRTISNVLAQDSPGDGEDKGRTKDGKAAWKRTPVTIKVPYNTHMAVPGCEDYTLSPGFYHRNLMSVIREKVGDTDQFKNFHTTPYQLFHGDPTDPIRIHGELYSSDSFLEEHKKVQALSTPDCQLEKVVLGVMLASDATQLRQFSDKTLWPVYLCFGNESKYLRSRTSAKLFEDIAYLERVSTIVNSIYFCAHRNL